MLGTSSLTMDWLKVSILTLYTTEGRYLAPIRLHMLFISWISWFTNSKMSLSMLAESPGVLNLSKTDLPWKNSITRDIKWRASL